MFKDEFLGTKSINIDKTKVKISNKELKATLAHF